MPPNQLNEQEIQFKKRARRRLVGAIALVLLMVTVLPMVLDDRSVKTQQEEIVITIPSQDGTDFTSKVIPVAPVKPLPESNLIDKPVPDRTAEDSPKPEQQNLADPEAPVAAVAQEPSTSTIAKKESTEATPVESSNKNDTFTVQIGVFSDAANVKKLQQKLQTLGYKSYTEKLQTPKGEKIRLRTAAFSSRTQAEDALSAIRDSGLSGMVVPAKQDS